ncbi:GGDEF and EAL domain-containing protein [Lacticaseibacillus zhaodongensis]|uniref:GGDEF and EAL domain-containing protein n=1 Tax=Lacticaseibacillus zhaodongensis TaxID=2668065 RepID=UPI0012D3105B|nr:GGDEF and EAL domain-containing protein [Lacticaseibacillus zhaodongensis]
MFATIDPAVLLPQVALLVFAIGFVCALVLGYTLIWQRVVGNTSLTKWQQIAIRTALPLTSWILSGLLIATSMTSIQSAWIYASIGLFLVAFPVLDNQLGRLEYLLRCAALFAFWIAGHWANLVTPQVLLTLAGLAGLLVLIRLRIWDLRYRFWYCMAAGAYISLAYWLTVPNVTLTTLHVYLSIGAYLLMTALTCAYWIYKRRNKLAARQAASEDLTVNNVYASYARNVASLFEGAKQSHQPLTMAVMDIDHFADINERYGHMGANEILTQVVEELQNVLLQYSAESHLFRSGGEEFSVIFVNTPTTIAAPIILDCWDTIRTHIFTYKDNQVMLTISAGLSQIQSIDKDVDPLYKRANSSMTQSKHSGRDAITVEGVPQHARQARDWLPDYTYFAQPIVDVRPTSHPVMLNELLLRAFDRNQWRLPDDFEIPTTTQISLIKRVLNHSNVPNVTVNLTAKQFSDAEIANDFVHFKRHEPRLKEFVIEIMDAPDLVTVERISKIYHANGIKIYLDDVGSDNSYELVLHMFNYIDGIKFAMQNLRKTNDSKQLLERIAFWKKIAEQHNLEFILEGVENQEESDYSYRQSGIFRQQGYYFGKPALPQDK